MNDVAVRDLSREPLSLADFEAAASHIYEVLHPTAQIAWPLLAERCGCEVWVKHENHLPTGAFKVRGGLWFMHQLASTTPDCPGVVAATRGNHGQSIAFAAARHGLQAVIVVPHGNNADKNRAMRALGAELIEAGDDFDAALEHAADLAASRGLFAMPSFDPHLVQGVGTYAVEFLRAHPDLDTIYAPIGLGSGLCGVLAARDALGLDTEIVGVVSAHADTYARSLEAGTPVETRDANTLADGMAVRKAASAALAYMRGRVSRIIPVTDDEVLTAIRIYFEDTHNIAEGAAAAPLAGLLREADRHGGKKIGLVLSGGNIDRSTLLRALA